LARRLEHDERKQLFVIGFPQGIIDALPRESVLEWVARSPDRRASAIAHLTAPDFGRDDSLAAALADLYGEREAVGSALFARLTTGAWNGSLSDCWSELADQMEQVSRMTPLPGVRHWARRAGEWLRRMEARDRDSEAERELEMSQR
jgi:hypothetical protein